MPLDSTNYVEAPVEVKPEVQIIDKMIARLSIPENWCKSYVEGPRACIVKALANFDYNAMTVGDEIERVVGYLFPQRKEGQRGYVGIGRFNDHPDTTHTDVMIVLHRARDILAKRSR